MSDEKISPTYENVLPEMKKFVYKENGKLLKSWGGLPCPWCKSEMVNIRPSYFATCLKDPTHQVIWIPWGG